MLIKILIGLVLVIILLGIVIAMRPSAFRVSRSIAISAPLEAVFAQVNDFHKWEAWSPWAKIDPNAKTKYEGASAGVGAAFGWSGNSQIGEGRMNITESHPNESILINLEFLRPMKAKNLAEFTFKPDGNHTTVTWTMTGKNNFIGKAIGLFINCDKMIGCQFEKGLAQMKSVTEVPVKK